MKKLLFILLLFFSYITTAQEGYWVSKYFKVIDSVQGWSPTRAGMIIDFKNSTIFSLLKDSTLNIKVNKLKKEIRPEGFPVVQSYEFKKDTIEMEFLEANIINVFFPIKFKEELNFSKEKIENLLINNSVFIERYSVSFQFEKERNKSSNVFGFKTFNYSWKGKQQKGTWYIEKIKGNVFIGITADGSWAEEMNIYRVISFNEKFIDLETIKEYYKEPKSSMRLIIKK